MPRLVNTIRDFKSTKNTHMVGMSHNPRFKCMDIPQKFTFRCFFGTCSGSINSADSPTPLKSRALTQVRSRVWGREVLAGSGSCL